MSEPSTAVADTAAALFWSVTTVLLFAFAVRLGRRLFPSDDLLPVVLHALVLSITVVVVVVTVFGGLGLLYPPLVIGTVLVGSAAGLRFLRAPRAVAAVTDPQVGLPPPVRLSAWLVPWAALFSFLLAHAAVSGLATFPTDVDSLTYHLPLIRHWLQAHSLYAPDGSHWSFPGNLEAVGLWVVGPFSGDFLISLTNFPFAAVLALAMAELARSLRLTPVLCQVVGLASVANFIVFRQLLDAENDVAAVALFTACLAYGFRHLRDGRPPDLVMAVVCGGLLCGVKYYAVGYSVVALGVVAGASWCLAGWRGGVRALGLAVPAVALLSGYWYVRNLVVSGTPLYPIGAGSAGDGGVRVLAGMWGTTLLGHAGADAFALYLHAIWQMMGPLTCLAVVCWPAAAVWLAGSGGSAGSPDRVTAVQRRALVVASAGCLALVLVTPFLVENIPNTRNQLREAWTPARYSLCFLSLAVVMFATCANDCAGSAWLRQWSVSVRIRVRHGTPTRSLRTGGSLAVVPVGAVVVLGLAQLVTVDRAGWLPIRPLDTLLLGGDLLGVGLVVAVARPATWPGAWWIGRVAGVLFVLAAVLLTPILSHRWHTEFVRFYDRHYHSTAFRRLRSSDPPVRSLCAVNLTEVYPFFGSRGDVRVIQPVQAQTPELLAGYMDTHGTDFLVTKCRLAQFDVAWARAPWLDETYLANQTGVTTPGDGSGIGVFRWVKGGDRFALAPW
jgi:hypothetical protein